MSDSIFDYRQMEGEPPEQQATKAILHVIGQIINEPKVRYHLGLGSQSFALLTEAYASLTNQPVRAVREVIIKECKNMESMERE